MPAHYSFERLETGDLERMRATLRLYSDAFDDPDAYVKHQPDDEYLTRLLARDDFIQIAALHADMVVGALSAYVLPKFEQARSEIYVYDLAVEEQHRRCGLATGMFEALKPIARSCDAWVIYVQADKGDEAPTALYSKLGKREDVLHFDIALDND